MSQVDLMASASVNATPKHATPVSSSIVDLFAPAKNSSFTAISEKHDSENYLLWCQQVEPVIKAHQWEQQDQLLLAWLQSTISRDMLTRVVGSKNSQQLWDKIHAYFQAHTRAKSRHLRSELRNSTLENCLISEFLLKIQNAIGEPISIREHFDVILKGLLQDCESTISLICGKFGPVSIEEVEALLLGHEARLKRFRKAFVPLVSLTISSTASNSSSQAPVSQPNSDPNADLAADSGNRGGRGGRGGRNSLQCQVCHKFGLDASVCFHRFKCDYVSSIPFGDASQNSNLTVPWSSQGNSQQQFVNSALASMWPAMSCPLPWPYSNWNYYGHQRATAPAMFSMPQFPSFPATPSVQPFSQPRQFPQVPMMPQLSNGTPNQQTSHFSHRPLSIYLS